MLVKLSINQILGYLFETTITPYKKKQIMKTNSKSTKY